MTFLDRIAIYLLIGGFAVLVVTGLYARYEYVVKQNVVLARDRDVAIDAAKNNAEELAKEKGRNEQLDKLLAARQLRELDMIQKDLAGLKRGLNDLKDKDPEVRKWADERVPSAVAERLRADPDGSAQGGGEGVPAPRAPAAVPGGGLFGKHKR